ncbi:DUF4296 domain-containing protein [Flavobacteriaceae bacterium AU392]|nr:DUF4296 domain-containing protein [Flavobacteriaceae bacterium]RKM85083.1 DUF4296 domain-containing protein [Flavobacteriaceae bacterium AU392]
MRLLFKYILFLILITSCHNNTIEKPKKPKNLISKEKMVDILYDMTIITHAKSTQKRILENKGFQPERYVFEKYNIDSLQFTESNEYYTFNIDDYQQIYIELDIRFKADKKIYQAIVDSIKKAANAGKIDLNTERSKSLNPIKERIETNTEINEEDADADEEDAEADDS